MYQVWRPWDAFDELQQQLVVAAFNSALDVQYEDSKLPEVAAISGRVYLEVAGLCSTTAVLTQLFCHVCTCPAACP